jgi:hypothetical protein
MRTGMWCHRQRFNNKHGHTGAVLIAYGCSVNDNYIEGLLNVDIDCNTLRVPLQIRHHEMMRNDYFNSCLYCMITKDVDPTRVASYKL